MSSQERSSESAPPPSLPIWERLALVILSPLLCILLVEGAVRLSRVDVDNARNGNFEIGVPVWLLADPNWVKIQQDRLARPRGVKAADVAWLRNFEEARYIQYKLKPRIRVEAVNPFNEIDVAKGLTFTLTSNRQGFRSDEFGPRRDGRLRIVSIGDSSTFGWGVHPAYTYQALTVNRLGGQERAEFHNLGMPGFTSRHGMGLLEHYVGDLRPEVLVASFGANDGRFVLRPTDDVLDADDRWVAGVRYALLHLRAFRLLRMVLFRIYDPFAAKPGETRATVQSVPRQQYADNLRAMAARARSLGATTVFLSVCAPSDYARTMRQVARETGAEFVDALTIFKTRLPELQGGTLYPAEIAYHRRQYGDETLARDQWLYVTTDGCHPNRAGHSLIADALAAAIERQRRDRVAHVHP
jgi:lysophospholipase L1-like esterase